ncbi:PREDICTED: putative WEB family protein At4g17210 [Camelina sativa]|uniref:WEB family protein At4g17210 n=1 Tax=Camelina sativa TaxID=90675 RepID=A0ABM0UEN2_CAMSA|nr:PREDICTED: putative WEB family protein At4g17210 [Camelina sativa]
MAKIRTDAPVMPPETPPRSTEVGEIDTRAPFQSVRDAVSLFRQVSFSKKQQPQPQRLSSSSSPSQDTTDHVSEKETQLMLAEQEMDRVKLCLDGSVAAKARALSDLDSAQRKAADLRVKLESTKHSRKCAIYTKHTMYQRLEQLQSDKQETERAREDYILITAELCIWVLISRGMCCITQIGTDIEDFKCSWLVVKALERCSEEQTKILYENYGKSEPSNVAKVKALYKEVDLEAVFMEYERESYEKLTKLIEAHQSKEIQAVLKSFLAKIYKRQK